MTLSEVARRAGLPKSRTSARLYLITSCGHWAQMEHPEEFDRVVHEFVSAN